LPQILARPTAQPPLKTLARCQHANSVPEPWPVQSSEAVAAIRCAPFIPNTYSALSGLMGRNSSRDQKRALELESRKPF
jgi:hypothetical protein